MRDFWKGRFSFEGTGWNIVKGIAVINLLLAFVAFVKDVAFAAYFGTTEMGDALALPFFVLDSIGNGLFASAVGVSFVPMLTSLISQGENDKFRRIYKIGVIQVLFLSISLMSILYLSSDMLLKWLGGGLNPETLAISERLYNRMLPLIAVFPLALLGSAVLQAMGSFLIPVWGQILFNGIFLLSILGMLAGYVPREQGVHSVTAGIVAGAVSMGVVVFWAVTRKMSRLPMKPATGRQENSVALAGIADLKSMYHLLVPYTIILVSGQLVSLVERNLAGSLDTGTLVGLNYAVRLAQFPNWVFVSAVTAVALPSLAQARAARNDRQLKRRLVQAVKMSLLISIPFAVVIFIFRYPLVSLLFERGAFDSHSVKITGDILAGYSLAIVGQALSAVFLRYCLAVEKMRLPTVMYLISSGITIGLDYRLVGQVGAAGLGYGAAIGAGINLFMIVSYSVKSLQNTGKEDDAHESFSDHYPRL